MLYAVLMAVTLAALAGIARGRRVGVALAMVAMAATAWAFVSDITDPLTLSF